MKAVLFCCVALAAVILVHGANMAIEPALPRDMPSDSRFMPTGYDLEHNERKGTWVACHTTGVGDEQCRVTDARGIVLFQGAFLAVKDARAISSGFSSGISSVGSLNWVNGPAEDAPVPLIPMSDGSILVPQQDRDALIDRWNQRPEEWAQLQRRTNRKHRLASDATQIGASGQFSTDSRHFSQCWTCAVADALVISGSRRNAVGPEASE